MTSIREIVQDALSQRYLSIDAEDGLRELLEGKYGREDFHAFVSLQRAFLDGQIVQESRVKSEAGQDSEENAAKVQSLA
ncbi:MAG: hypothetical protein AAGA67_09255 [Cyanobacteria bacterium P01_F01_bin.153]